MSNYGNIKVKGLKKDNPKLKGEFILPFYRDEKLLKDLETFNAFIKRTEKIIRISSEYTYYKSYLMGVIGLNYCMVFPKITDEKAPIEMHHGPMLTLFDICSIVTTHLIKNGVDVTTFLVADLVLQEHFKNNIQVVMLCETAHNLIDTGELFLNLKQGWGDIFKFLERYNDGVDERIRYLINDYLNLSRKYHSSDMGILTPNSLTNWSGVK